MIPDLDAVHIWNNEFSINRLWQPGGMLNFPRVRIDPLTGLPGFHALPEGEDRRSVPIGRPYREIPRTSTRTGKSLVYSGWLEAQNEDDLDGLEGDMTAAFADMADGTMVIEQFGTGKKFFYIARCTALVIDGNAPAHKRGLTLGYERSFNLGLRMSDGRFYEDVLQSANADAAPDNQVVVETGKVPTDPIIRLTGPFPVNSWVEHQEQVARLTLKTALLAGEYIDIDFADRSVLHSDQVAHPGDVGDDFVDYDETSWWDNNAWGLTRGTNTLIFHGGAGSGMTVSWRRAYFG